MTDTAILEVDRLRKDFGPVRALDDVSFSVSEGEVFGFLGPAAASTAIALTWCATTCW